MRVPTKLTHTLLFVPFFRLVTETHDFPQMFPNGIKNTPKWQLLHGRRFVWNSFLDIYG